MKPETTALVLIEFQNDFTSDGGALHGAVAESMDSTGMLDHAREALEALEAAGMKPRSGCRMGICNTCACGKSSGSTRHLPSGELLHEPTQALKLCIHSAATDLELDL